MATTAANSAIRLLWALDAREVIARKIRERRAQLGLTQQDVAERGRLALRSYQRYEEGSVMPRPRAREKVALALELPDDALEPPAEVTSEEEPEIREQLREVLARLARIEGALSARELEDVADEIAAAADEPHGRSAEEADAPR